MKRQRQSRAVAGFTLIEVLAALAVLAIALSALIRSGTSTTANAIYLEEKSFAHLVALNAVATLQLQPNLPAVGTSKGSVEMAGREWRWQSQITKTDYKLVNRLEMSVERADKEGRLAEVIAFLPLGTKQ